MLKFLCTQLDPVYDCLSIVSHYLYKMPLLWFCPIFITKLITELSAHRLFYSQSKSLPSRYCSVLLFTFVNSVNMLSCLSGDSFSNQSKKTGTHLCSSSHVAGKQSARYFQLGLAQHFLLFGELGLVAFFDEREARPQPEPVPRNKQWRELLMKRLEFWRPNASLTSPSLGLRVACVQTSHLPQKKGYLRADVCKYRPEVGKIKFLKNPPKIM